MADRRFKSVEIVQTEEEIVKNSSAYILPVGDNKVKMVIPDDEGEQRVLESGSPDLLGLEDTPNSFNGQANKFLVVSPLENGIVFSDVDIGTNGFSAYEIAQRNGFSGTEEEWLDSLKGDPGEPTILTFEVNEDMHLIMQLETSNNLTFELDSNGHLIVNN